MDKRIIYSRPDGGVAVVIPALGARLVFRIALNATVDKIQELRPPQRLEDAFTAVGLGRGWSAAKAELVTVVYAEDETEFLARVEARSVPSGASGVETVDVTAIPGDRTFRNAWKKGAGKVEVDMPKARLIHMDRIRAARNQMLTVADNDLKAAEDGNDQSEIARLRNRRKKLRGIPQDFDLSVATTPAELKDLWPDELADSQPPRTA